MPSLKPPTNGTLALAFQKFWLCMKEAPMASMFTGGNICSHAVEVKEPNATLKVMAMDERRLSAIYGKVRRGQKDACLPGTRLSPKQTESKIWTMTDEEETYSTRGAPLSCPRLMQLMCCRLRMLSRSLTPFFILLEICDSKVGFLSRIDRHCGYSDGDGKTEHLEVNCSRPQSVNGMIAAEGRKNNHHPDFSCAGKPKRFARRDLA